MTQTIHEAIKMEAKLDIAIERVDKMNDALLVIGLGGTGFDMVRAVKQLFAERFVLPMDKDGNPIPVPHRTDYLAIDTDLLTLENNGLDKDEYLHITVPGLDAILKNKEANLHPYEQEWIDPSLSLRSGPGAGGVRQVSRFILGRNYDVLKSRIAHKLSKLVSVTAGALEGVPNRVNVVVCAGIGGGTGSGTFLDVPYIVRHIMAHDPHLMTKDLMLTGYLALPDVNIQKVHGDPFTSSFVKKNGYAALKELDFWMRKSEHRTPYNMRYSSAETVAWDAEPFDACWLLSSMNADGTVFNDGYSVMCQTMAENLLHYLAEERNAAGAKLAAYKSFEINLHTMQAKLNAIKRYPLCYKYRSVGAYTKRFPKREIMYYEGLKMLKTFIPPRDPKGNLVPNNALLTDGKNVFRVGKITLSINDLLNNAAAKVGLPAFLTSVTENLQNMKPAPHDRAHFASPNKWYEDVVVPAMNNHANAYLKDAWERFKSFADAVICDMEMGPFSLRAYLEDGTSDSLLKGLEGVLQDWKAKQANLSLKLPGLKKQCELAWPTFQKPPLLGKQKAIDNYMTALKAYYAQERAAAFLQAYIPALERLVRRVKEYLHGALIPLCEDILGYEETFSLAVKHDDKLVSNIFDLDDAMKAKIDAEYATTNIDHKFEKQLLGALCAASLKAEPNVDPYSGGLTFMYRKLRDEVLLKAMKEVVEQCFGQSNSFSLDDIIDQQCGADVAARQNYLQTMFTSMVSSAVTMFSQDPRMMADAKVERNFFSIPEEKDASREYLKNYMENKAAAGQIDFNETEIKDHIYCVMAWAGVPLARYSMMEALESEYSNGMLSPEFSMGTHLVYDGKPGSDYTRNWSKLPDPSPYYFIGGAPSPRAQAAYTDVKKIMDEAVACGLVKVNVEDVNGLMEKPTISLNLHFTPGANPMAKTSEMMKREIDAIEKELDPVTRMPATGSALLAKLEGYKAKASGILLQPNCDPAVVAHMLGLAGANINPFSDAAKVDPAVYSEAAENFKKLSMEMAAAYVSLFPKHVEDLRKQLEAMKYLQEKIDVLVGGSKKWGPRVAYAAEFADLYIHKIIMPGFKGYQYADYTGARVNIIEDHLLDPDLGAELPLLKNEAYIADLKPEHAVRMDLAAFLKEKKDNLMERFDQGNVEAAELQAMVELAQKLIDMCDKDQKQYMAKKRMPGVDPDTIEKILQCYAAIKSNAEAIKANYGDVLASM